MTDHAVLIAAAELLPPLKARLGAGVGGLLAFTDTEALRALEAITAGRPELVLLERNFAATPRGAALINRIKADPSLADTRIQVIPTEGKGAREPGLVEPLLVLEAEAPSPPPVQAAPELDYRGTRRAVRFRVMDPTDILVDGTRGSLVDLSPLGSQLVTTSILKPNQRVRLSLTDEAGTVRCAATVVWASFEIPKGTGPRYRAGVEFVDPDRSALDAFIRRHKQN